METTIRMRESQQILARHHCDSSREKHLKFEGANRPSPRS